MVGGSPTLVAGSWAWAAPLHAVRATTAAPWINRVTGLGRIIERGVVGGRRVDVPAGRPVAVRACDGGPRAGRGERAEQRAVSRHILRAPAGVRAKREEVTRGLASGGAPRRPSGLLGGADGLDLFDLADDLEDGLKNDLGALELELMPGSFHEHALGPPRDVQEGLALLDPETVVGLARKVSGGIGRLEGLRCHDGPDGEVRGRGEAREVGDIPGLAVQLARRCAPPAPTS